MKKGTKKVLIVEDERSVRKTLVKAVENLGFIAIESPNGRHGFETLECNDGIRLVITDMMMPAMSGRELILAIREKKEWKDLPIIIMSAVVSVKEIADLLEKGAKAFIAKPVKMADIKEYLIRYLT